MTAGAARGATILQVLQLYDPRACYMRYATLPRSRAGAARAVAAASSRTPLLTGDATLAAAAPRVSSLESPKGAAAAAAAQLAAAVAAAQTEAAAMALLVRWLVVASPVFHPCIC